MYIQQMCIRDSCRSAPEPQHLVPSPGILVGVARKDKFLTGKSSGYDLSVDRFQADRPSEIIRIVAVR